MSWLRATSIKFVHQNNYLRLGDKLLQNENRKHNFQTVRGKERGG